MSQTNDNNNKVSVEQFYLPVHNPDDVSNDEMGIILGCLLGGLFFVFLLVIILFAIRRRRYNKKQKSLFQDGAYYINKYYLIVVFIELILSHF